MALPSNECPCTNADYPDYQGCDLAECDPSMSNNELCEADKPLPDGNSTWDVNNCPNSFELSQLSFDVFKCVKGK